MHQTPTVFRSKRNQTWSHGPFIMVHKSTIQPSSLGSQWFEDNRTKRSFSCCLCCLKQHFSPDMPRSQQPKGRSAFTLGLRGAKQEGKQRSLADRSPEGRHGDGVSQSLLRDPPAPWTPLCLALAPAALWRATEEPWLALGRRIIIIWALQVWVSSHWNKLLKSMMNINIVGTRGKGANCSRMKYLHLIMQNYIEFESFPDVCYLKLCLSALPCLNKAAFVARCGLTV